MIKGIHHTAIAPGEVERTLRFCKDLSGSEEFLALEWKVGSRAADQIVELKDSSSEVVMLKAESACMELCPVRHTRAQARRPKSPGVRLRSYPLGLQVEDIDGESERLKAAGTSFHCTPRKADRGLQATYGGGPRGNAVELLEVADPNDNLSAAA